MKTSTLRALGRVVNWTALLIVAIAAPLSLSAQTNFIDAFHAATASQPTVWGGIYLGTPTAVTVDPRATAVANQLQQALARRGAPSAARAGTGESASADQQAAMEALVARAGSGVEIHLRPGNQTIMQVRGAILERPAPAPAALPGTDVGEQTARRFLRVNRALLRLEDPDQELQLESDERDDLGRRHFRFSQTYQGLPVWPNGLSVHLDSRGNVDIADGAYVPTPSGISVAAAIDLDAAERAAADSVPHGDNAVIRDPALIIYAPLSQAPRLAWSMTLSLNLIQSWTVLVDAQNGRILNRIRKFCDANVATTGVDLLGASRNLNVWSANGKFYMADTTKPSYNPGFDPIQDPRGVITIFDAREVQQQNLQTVYMVESTNVANWLPAAVGAAYNFSLTYDYFFTYHNRNSLDGQGGNIRAAVRIAQMDNAYWSGDNNMMFFGDVRPYPNALDVVGHELAHGVTQNAADLVYELQPGALNESFSDIFGEMVEARGTGANDWKMGTHLGMTFRDMANPGSLQIPGLNQPYPSKMSEYINLPNSNDGDHGGVHLNSSIPNHAFYLLAAGLPGAIGLQDAEKIFYRCLTQHLQKQSQFVDARLGCLAAAEALFGAGSPQALKTAEAFGTVEIFATPPTPPPTPLPTVEGPDSTLFVAFDSFFFEIALGRRETALSDPAPGVLLVTSIKQARPSVSGEGSFAIFADSADDMGVVNTAPPYDLETLGVAGLVHSVAMSPDGSRFAFVLNDAFGTPDNRITVIDLANGTNRTYTLVAPVLDAEAANTVVYADSMVFSADGTQLIYDALSEIHFGSGAQLQRWSIARLNLSTATTTILVPPLEGFDTGNPSLGRAGNRYLTFDAVNVASGNGSIITLDLFTGNAGVVGNVGQGWGYPGFTGDESAVVYAAVDSDFLRAPWTGHSLVKQNLTPDRLTPSGQAAIWLGDAWIGVIYRRGTFAASNALPAVTLTSPTNGAVLPTGAAIMMTATANDADGTVTKVEFYNGAAKLGEDTTPGYELVWNDPPAGTHRLIARAFDNLGGATDSEAVTVTVGSAAPFQLSAVRLLDGIRIAATGPPGSYTVQESTNLNSWSDLLPMLIDESGTGLLDDTRTPNPAQRLFYRLRKD